MDRGAWEQRLHTVQKVTKSETRLNMHADASVYLDVSMSPKRQRHKETILTVQDTAFFDDWFCKLCIIHRDFQEKRRKIATLLRKELSPFLVSFKDIGEKISGIIFFFLAHCGTQISLCVRIFLSFTFILKNKNWNFISLGHRICKLKMYSI